MTEKKSERLNSILKEFSSVVIGFSGGVDSSFLLHRAHILELPGLIAVTLRTPYIPANEIADSIEFTAKRGIRHNILNLGFPESIRHNPGDRCYTCKKILFSELTAFAAQNNIARVVDGSNADDTDEYRPGLKALRELGIRSPLMEAGLTKQEIRELSKKEGLSLWDKPAMACLLTRIPYDTDVSEETLRMIESAENMLFELGFPGTRVRVQGDSARIECLPGYMERIIQKPLRNQIISSLKKTGFRYISLDLEGYRTGSSDSQSINHEYQRS
jgi:pyridinium-3,5-biscarboxylic acid mononucleotide sulfurtransferase